MIHKFGVRMFWFGRSSESTVYGSERRFSGVYFRVLAATAGSAPSPKRAAVRVTSRTARGTAHSKAIDLGLEFRFAELRRGE